MDSHFWDCSEWKVRGKLELKEEHAKKQLAMELLKAENANQQQLIEIQKLEMQKGLLTVSMSCNQPC